jgi:hypothetical protein
MARETDRMSLDRFELAKQEYIKLKDEQTKRIGFRDNLLYVNLVLISGIMSFVLGGDFGNPLRLHGLFVAGWVSLVLGWTYLVNDEKISAIGRYIRETLPEALDPDKTGLLFGWEVAHRSDKRRPLRKLQQLVVDILSFPGIGLASLALFVVWIPHLGCLSALAALVQAALLLILVWEIWVYADLASSQSVSRS